MIEAVIFDMDGLIINSEPLWRKAEIAIFKEVSVFLTDDDCAGTAGLRIDEVVDHWFKQFPWNEKHLISKPNLVIKIVDKVIELIQAEGEPLLGIPEIFNFFQAKHIPMVIASSSHYNIINAVVEKLQIGTYFEFLYSAEDEEFGKPHPGIFISAARKLDVACTDCIVFEDSFNGVLAGLSARMKVIAVPDPHLFEQPKFDIAQLKLKSLTDFDTLSLQQLS
jgi:HAD superfamily hydrolase (TIGR01509 family)